MNFKFQISNCKTSRILLLIISFMSLFLSIGEGVQAACRNPNIAEDDPPFLRPAAASGSIEIKSSRTRSALWGFPCLRCGRIL